MFQLILTMLIFVINAQVENPKLDLIGTLL
jgi:hypothetical protein